MSELHCHVIECETDFCSREWIRGVHRPLGIGTTPGLLPQQLLRSTRQALITGASRLLPKVFFIDARQPVVAITRDTGNDNVQSSDLGE